VRQNAQATKDDAVQDEFLMRRNGARKPLHRTILKRAQKARCWEPVSSSQGFIIICKIEGFFAHAQIVIENRTRDSDYSFTRTVCNHGADLRQNHPSAQGFRMALAAVISIIHLKRRRKQAAAAKARA